MTPIDKAEIARLRGLLEKATTHPLPWTAAGDSVYGPVPPDGDGMMGIVQGWDRDVAQLIAQSVSALPSLLDAIEERDRDLSKAARLRDDYARSGAEVKAILAEVGIVESTPEMAATAARERIEKLLAAAKALRKTGPCSDPDCCDTAIEHEAATRALDAVVKECGS